MTLQMAAMALTVLVLGEADKKFFQFPSLTLCAKIVRKWNNFITCRCLARSMESFLKVTLCFISDCQSVANKLCSSFNSLT